MKFFKATKLEGTDFNGVTIFPEDKKEEAFLKLKIEKMKDLDYMRKFLSKSNK